MQKKNARYESSDVVIFFFPFFLSYVTCVHNVRQCVISRRASAFREINATFINFSLNDPITVSITNSKKEIPSRL